VAAEHCDHALSSEGGLGNGVDDGPKVTRNEDVGERANECVERSVVARRSREFVG